MSSCLDTTFSRRQLLAAVAGTAVLATALPTLAETPPPPDVG
ncbi:DUF1868 domain-containing protein, partial [Xanthomonas campestris pv. raphani]|nr:DUF1868 domain-containing protein [Xanthomonas campestris pv. raphani]